MVFDYKFVMKRDRVAMVGLWFEGTSKTLATLDPDLERCPLGAPHLRGKSVKKR